MRVVLKKQTLVLFEIGVYFENRFYVCFEGAMIFSLSFDSVFWDRCCVKVLIMGCLQNYANAFINGLV